MIQFVFVLCMFIFSNLFAAAGGPEYSGAETKGCVAVSEGASKSLGGKGGYRFRTDGKSYTTLAARFLNGHNDIASSGLQFVETRLRLNALDEKMQQRTQREADARRLEKP